MASLRRGAYRFFIACHVFIKWARSLKRTFKFSYCIQYISLIGQFSINNFKISLILFILYYPLKSGID